MSRSEHTRGHAIGTVMSEEQKNKIRESMVGRPNTWDRKFTEDDINYIRKNYIPRHNEFGTRGLARKFDVSHSIILDVLHGKSYKDIS